MTKHLTLLLFIGLTWGQDTTSLSPIDDRGSDKLVQSFRSDLGKFYTVTYNGKYLGEKNNKVHFKPINDTPIKLLQLKEIKELKQDNKVLIKSGKWKVEPESIVPYDGTFVDFEETNKKELSKHNGNVLVYVLGCGIATAIILPLIARALMPPILIH